MHSYWVLTVIIFGLLSGSFLNVLIYRLPRGESIIRPASHCLACGVRLAWYDLVPVVSYLVLRGRCRRCGGRISPRYPAVEILTAALFLLVYAVLRSQAEAGAFPQESRFIWVLVKYLFFTAGLIAAALIDLEHRLIPNRLVLGLLAGAAVLVPLARDVSLESSAAGALIAGGALLFLGWVTRGGMGGGDVKFAAVAGLYLGLQKVLLGLFLGAVLGSVAGLVLIAAGKRTRKDYIPFGPYLSAGFLVAMLWGEELVRWYRLCFGMG
ncbi:MAG: prepilin peptidase [Thermoanaerobacteraceae bacterium]|nr:prepilin peptidase [Thermoanaerobacteraceae bacterium]